MAQENGAVYIVENDKPSFKLVCVEHDTSIEMTDDEKTILSPRAYCMNTEERLRSLQND